MVYFLDQLEDGQDVAGLQRNLDAFSKLTREAVVFLWDISTSTQRASYAEHKNYPAVVTQLTRHVCEFLDGVSILAAQGAAEPCKPLLRSAIEAVLLINYVLESDSERRGLAYHVAHAHRKIKLYDKVEPAKQAPFATFVAGLKTMLASPEYAPIEAEWQATKKGRGNWFSLFKGPQNVKELADLAKRPELYEWFYGYYSSAMHAGDGFDKIGRGNNGTGEKAIKPLRHPETLQGMVITAVSLCSMVTTMLLERWGTHEQKVKAQADYIANIRPDLMVLRGDQLIHAPWL